MSFPLFIRLENKQEKPSLQIHVKDEPGEASYDKVVGDVIDFAFPGEEHDLFKTELQCELRTGWWLPVSDAKALANVIQFTRNDGRAFLSATVDYKVASLAVSPTIAQVSASSVDSKPKVVKRKTTTKAKSSGGEKKPVFQKILGALAELESVGISPTPRVQAAMFAGYSHVRSTGFAKAISGLKVQGLIEYPDAKTVRLTSAGKTAAGSVVSAPTSNAVVHERIKKLLKPKTCEIFDTLSNGAAMDRMAVANATGYSHERSTGFAKAVSTMSSLGILEYAKDPSNPNKKLLQLTSIAFPFGRPGASAAKAFDIEDVSSVSHSSDGTLAAHDLMQGTLMDF